MKNIKFLFSIMTAASFCYAVYMPAYAAVIPDSMKQAMQTEYSGMPSLLNLVVSLVIVVALIYITGIVYSRMSRSDKFKLGLKSNEDYAKSRFTILSSLPLGQNKNLYSIEINGKILVIGATQQNITLLKEFDKGIETEIKEAITEPKQTKSTVAKKDNDLSGKIDFEDLDKNLNDISSIYRKYRS